MARHTFLCIDGHTAGNPVRLVAAGGPRLDGPTMIERRAHFEREFDWVRRGLMFEPRGHDLMSGAILYPPTRDDCDIAILFIETSGCLAMCGHATIGAVTLAIEHGLVRPRTPGRLHLDTPAGPVACLYACERNRVKTVRFANVPSFLYRSHVAVAVEGLGELVVDVAYGGNFYTIVDAQENYRDLRDYAPSQLIAFGNKLRQAVNAAGSFVHPEIPAINRVSHVMWTGAARNPGAHSRNAVLYGAKAIDRSPCGTGTSARMAQWHAKGKLRCGDTFVHESIIGSCFTGRIESETAVAGLVAIRPSIEGSAYMTGINSIFIDDEEDPYAHGFQLLD